MSHGERMLQCLWNVHPTSTLLNRSTEPHLGSHFLHLWPLASQLLQRVIPILWKKIQPFWIWLINNTQKNAPCAHGEHTDQATALKNATHIQRAMFSKTLNVLSHVLVTLHHLSYLHISNGNGAGTAISGSQRDGPYLPLRPPCRVTTPQPNVRGDTTTATLNCTIKHTESRSCERGGWKWVASVR